jgi:transposase
MVVQVANKAEVRSSAHRQPGPPRDFKAMEERRMRAADLFRRGVIPAEIARQLGVTHQVVSEWRTAWREAGRAALRGAGHAGRPRKLSTAQLAKVARTLGKGAEANGYVTDLWTLPRVAEVIERMTGVSYHPGHVWYILRDQLAWTWQRPARRAVERDDEAIERWIKRRWPHVKKSPAPERADRV